MEICYENAYGGGNFRENPENPMYDVRNLIGKGYIKKWRNMTNQRLPNIEFEKFPLRKRTKKNKVAGFGAIPAYWEPRRKYVGTMKGEPNPNQPRPPDFNPLFYQCAPQDQQFDKIEGGDAVALYNLTPTEKLIFSIPTVRFECETLLAGDYHQNQAILQSVIIEPEFPRLIMVWKASVPCENQEESIEYTKVEYEMKLH